MRSLGPKVAFRNRDGQVASDYHAVDPRVSLGWGPHRELYPVCPKRDNFGKVRKGKGKRKRAGREEKRRMSWPQRREECGVRKAEDNAAKNCFNLRG